MVKNSLKTRTIKSAKWTMGKSVLSIFYGPVYKIFLASLIDAVGFAYISVFAIILNIGDMLNSMGIGQALLVEKDIDERQFSSVFLMDLLKGALLCLVIIAISPLIEIYYEMENLRQMVCVLGICVFFTGATRTFKSYLKRELKIDIIVKNEILSMVLDSVFSLIFIFGTKSIFGYVWGTLVSRVVSSFVMIIYALKEGLRVKWVFDYSSIKGMMGFARSVSARQIFNYLAQIADEVIIAGVFADKRILGYYYFAKDLISKPQSVIASSVSGIALPLISKFSENIEKIRKLFLQLSKLLAAVAFPTFVGIVLTADKFLPLLFGNEYIGAVLYVQMFCISAAISTISQCTASAVLYTLKKPGILLWTDIIVNSFYIVALMLLGKTGIYVILFATVLKAIISALVLQGFAQKMVGIVLGDYIKELMNIIIAVGTMAVAVFVGNKCMIELGVLSSFVLSVIIGGSIYTSIILILERKFIKDVFSMAKK